MENKKSKKKKNGNSNKPKSFNSNDPDKNEKVNKNDINLLVKETEFLDDTIYNVEHKVNNLKNKKRLDLQLNNRFASEKMITQGIAPIFRKNSALLKNLRTLTLNLSDNRINTPEGFKELSLTLGAFEVLSQITLNLSNNKFDQIHFDNFANALSKYAEIQNFSSLNICLSDNRIKSIEKFIDFLALKGLESLDLDFSNNKLTSSENKNLLRRYIHQRNLNEKPIKRFMINLVKTELETSNLCSDFDITRKADIQLLGIKMTNMWRPDPLGEYFYFLSLFNSISTCDLTLDTLKESESKQLNEESLVFLNKSLKNLSSIYNLKLSLTGNNIQGMSIDRGFEVFPSTNMLMLNMSANYLTNFSLSSIAECLIKSSPSLNVLEIDIRANPVSEEALFNLLEGIINLPLITTLTIRNDLPFEDEESQGKAVGYFKKIPSKLFYLRKIHVDLPNVLAFQKIMRALKSLIFAREQMFVLGQVLGNSLKTKFQKGIIKEVVRAMMKLRPA